ncbi:hypothetical protein [Azospirillum halopraeferens]|uniref:hypothetical protein n=1 Tax=Azospirillum halopraeferens TaxID=34010 RepID=UPI0004188B9C|nr:hypothetical protein [Azospirillum halopraeferens]
MDGTRQALLRWMTGVMEARGWSARAWAQAAGVTASNLTRFLHDPRTGSLPGTDTIGRLARAAGAEPHFLDDRRFPRLCRVPVLERDQAVAVLALGRRAAEVYVADRLRDGGPCVPVDRPVSRRAFALRVGARTLNAAGILPDDRVVLEPADEVEPRAGDVVITVGDDGVCGYRYHPPFLVPVSTDPDCGPTALDRARLAGVAMQVVRPLRG